MIDVLLSTVVYSEIEKKIKELLFFCQQSNQFQTDSSSKSSMDENAGLAGALARALAERSRVIQSDSDDGDSSDSAEEDDEWD
ncbi:hypothetical protein QYM36_002175 [Artemia franciscana]|uniref:Uncharacterized protein n=1 Tax=Artemia franciscana TaxID=6661 RepID=A0AA88I998_ARTSF|nr:hypothetical protein QYM36_002175 [Artemia franciscana]